MAFYVVERRRGGFAGAFDVGAGIPGVGTDAGSPIGPSPGTISPATIQRLYNERNRLPQGAGSGTLVTSSGGAAEAALREQAATSAAEAAIASGEPATSILSRPWVKWLGIGILALVGGVVVYKVVT